MRKRIAVVAALFALSVLAAAAVVACQGCSKSKQDAPKKTVSAVCPVMGTNIPDVSKAAGKSVYKGRTYYFCCPSCKPEFDKNPEKYVKKQGKK